MKHEIHFIKAMIKEIHTPPMNKALPNSPSTDASGPTMDADHGEGIDPNIA